MAVDVRERRINVKDLVIETPEVLRGGPFDPNTLINDTLWKSMEEEYIFDQRSYNFFHAIICLTNLRLIDPERSKNLVVPRDKIQKYIISVIRQDAETLKALGAYKILFPAEDPLSMLTPNVDVSSFGSRALDLLNDPWLLVNLKLLNPSMEFPCLSGIEWEKSKEMLADYKRRMGVDIHYIYPLVAIKIADANKYKEVEPTEKDWMGINKLFGFYGGLSSMWSFADAAANIRILAADEVRVDESGIHLAFHPKISAPVAIPQLPEAKKF